MLFREADVRTDDAVQIGREQGKVGHGFGRQGHAFGQLLRIGIIEVGDDAPHQGGCLETDIPFPMGQEFIEELQGHQFLMFRHVRRIFLKDADVRADILPLPFTAGRFDEVAEIAFITEDTHQADIVVDGGVLQLGDDVFPFEEDLFPLLGLRRISRFPGKVRRQLRDDAVFLHEFFEIGQFGIDLLVALALGIIDVVQFAQDDVEGFGEGIEMDDFLPARITAALNTEVRVDEEQRFDGEVFQFQIPDGMIGRNVADAGQAHAAAAHACIIIM